MAMKRLHVPGRGLGPRQRQRPVVRGIQREDKNIMGTLHFGLGTNVDVGGSIKSKIHWTA